MSESQWDATTSDDPEDEESQADQGSQAESVTDKLDNAEERAQEGGSS